MYTDSVPVPTRLLWTAQSQTVQRKTVKMGIESVVWYELFVFLIETKSSAYSNSYTFL